MTCNKTLKNTMPSLKKYGSTRACKPKAVLLRISFRDFAFLKDNKKFHLVFDKRLSSLAFVLDKRIITWHLYVINIIYIVIRDLIVL